MKYYIQFYDRLLNGEIDEAIASDGIMPLDGRLSFDNMINAGFEQARSLRKVQSYCGFKVTIGSSYLTGRACSHYQNLES